MLPECPGLPGHTETTPEKLALLAPCGSWDPQDDLLQDPPGCDWFTRPPEPNQSRAPGGPRVDAGARRRRSRLRRGRRALQRRPHVGEEAARLHNANLPDDRVLAATVRNDSLEPVLLVARDLGVRTPGGDEMESAAVFASPSSRCCPQDRGDEFPESEQLRIGLRARLQPGDTAPLTVSWRQQGEQAAVVDYGAGTLPVPSN